MAKSKKVRRQNEVGYQNFVLLILFGACVVGMLIMETQAYSKKKSRSGGYISDKESDNDEDNENEKVISFSSPSRISNPTGIQPVVIYTKMERTASRSFVGMITDILVPEDPIQPITFIDSPVSLPITLPEDRRLELGQLLMATTPDKPVLYVNHHAFLDFNLDEATMNKKLLIGQQLNKRPVYNIAFIRDPINRFISNYYVRREPGGPITRADDIAQTIDTCFGRKARECPDRQNYYQYFYYVPFFCGHDRWCAGHSQTDRDQAVTRAIENVKTKFKFVGIVEQFDKSLKALESTIPQTFSGISKRWAEDLKKDSKSWKNKSIGKKVQRSYSKETESIMRQRMMDDIRFYKAVKEYFETTYARID